MNFFRRSLLALPGLALFPVLIVAGVAAFVAITYGQTGQTEAQPAPAATREGRWGQDIDALTQQVLINT